MTSIFPPDLGAMVATVAPRIFNRCLADCLPKNLGRLRWLS